MPRNENPIEKNETLGHVVKVQQVIDFIVLSYLMDGRRYHSEMEQYITKTLDGVGVNDAYFSQRLRALAESGHVQREWETDNRYNRFYEITDSGVEYFKMLLKDLPDRVKLAQRVYGLFDSYIAKFNKVNLK
ncbi:DNA-binding PadR family transcriptional regulator [Paenibacillus phyllosphaerae]|uniref:DNA-binding PadR family transcriptional regulator n=1 Tax=Paenibacillus phyllosphaerae TaxID=274593 RepID=A0A7W5B2S5_9BACL|nr:helix-turn-helix transcriptional regulator [Paenibacillus phyllosphaerae]MBB3113373.1 DNA-binding PadR family transcriptional regulator [Paenibacillus phyllosphaerae]